MNFDCSMSLVLFGLLVVVFGFSIGSVVGASYPFDGDEDSVKWWKHKVSNLVAAGCFLVSVTVVPMFVVVGLVELSPSVLVSLQLGVLVFVYRFGFVRGV